MLLVSAVSVCFDFDMSAKGQTLEVELADADFRFTPQSRHPTGRAEMSVQCQIQTMHPLKSAIDLPTQQAEFIGLFVSKPKLQAQLFFRAFIAP